MGASDLAGRVQQGLRINTSVSGLGTGQGGRKTEDEDTMSANSAASDLSESEMSEGVSAASGDGAGDSREGREVWKGDVSAVIGLQKRGLRGLMEGRRLRERGASIGPQSQGQRVGLGIGGTG